MVTLVTGATGFIGSHLTYLLVQRGARVRTLVRPTSRLDAIAGLPVEIVRGDLREPSSLAEALRGVGSVYHAAADYRLWARDPREIYHSNVQGTRNLLAACREVGLDRFVYTSSVATMAVPRATLPDETVEACLDEMVGHYKRSKLPAEREVLAAAADGLPAVIVNPTTPVGPGDWKPTPTGRMIVDFLRGRMFGYVETGLNLVPVEDVAAGHLLAASRGRVGQRYILGGRNLFLKEIFETLGAITGRPAPRVRVPHSVAGVVAYASEVVARLRGTEPGVPREGVRMARHVMFVDASKACRDLGFESGPVEAALERAVRWYMEHGYAR
jgi:dihydroflavonol-4-reductase